jgi:hypothetical protein
MVLIDVTVFFELLVAADRHFCISILFQIILCICLFTVRPSFNSLKKVYLCLSHTHNFMDVTMNLPHIQSFVYPF